MALNHHHHHGAEITAGQSLMQSLPTATMPAITEDEHAPEADEPPEKPTQTFAKTNYPSNIRRQSLLTKALHTDSESHDDEESSLPLGLTRSSAYSANSGRSDWHSDDGLTSSGTTASINSSPPRPATYTHSEHDLLKPFSQLTILHQEDGKTEHHNVSLSPVTKPVVETDLGRKRCISFACGNKNTTPIKKDIGSDICSTLEAEKVETVEKKPCRIQFACPSKLFSKGLSKDGPPKPSRHISPPPFTTPRSPSPKSTPKRSHRGSDTTIKNASPQSIRKIPIAIQPRKFSPESTSEKSEATRFHEFASSDEEPEDWTRQSTYHKSPLTLDDTLRKENDIRKLGDEVEEEALQEEENEDDEDDEEDELADLSGDETDDEEGFAESDDGESDGSDGDYQWWKPQSRGSPDTMLPRAGLRTPTYRRSSNSSVSSYGGFSPKRSFKGKKAKALMIRPGTPELPDSTDFVCGTLDEDRPLENAYASCLEQRKLAKHRVTPQDIDPTFPTSDPDMETDEEDDEDLLDDPIEDSDAHQFFPGSVDAIEEDEPRGRKGAPPPSKRSPRPSPLRFRSPVPVKRGQVHRSPPPRALFGHSPRRFRSPPPTARVHSPPPSRHGSPSALPLFPFGTAFLGQRPQLTHTSSLPRSPHPLSRRPPSAFPNEDSNRKNDIAEDDDDDEGNHTERAYTRGAIDIVQGLERKRLKRRQKFYERYHRKEEKKRERGETKRPRPGQGAQRMRQIGIECAIYRGKGIMSV